MRLSALTTDALASLAADGKSPNTLLAYDVAFRLFVHFVTVTRNLPDDTKSFTPENVLLFKTALHEGDGKRGANPKHDSSAPLVARLPWRVRDDSGRTEASRCARSTR